MLLTDREGQLNPKLSYSSELKKGLLGKASATVNLFIFLKSFHKRNILLIKQCLEAHRCIQGREQEVTAKKMLILVTSETYFQDGECKDSQSSISTDLSLQINNRPCRLCF